MHLLTGQILTLQLLRLGAAAPVAIPNANADALAFANAAAEPSTADGPGWHLTPNHCRAYMDWLPSDIRPKGAGPALNITTIMRGIMWKFPGDGMQEWYDIDLRMRLWRENWKSMDDCVSTCRDCFVYGVDHGYKSMQCYHHRGVSALCVMYYAYQDAPLPHGWGTYPWPWYDVPWDDAHRYFNRHPHNVTVDEYGMAQD